MIQTMRTSSVKERPAGESTTTIWGLTPRDLHDAYWAARGVQCVTQGEHRTIDRTCDLFLLLDSDQCVIFDLASLVDRIMWRGARLTRVRIAEPAGEDSYFERIRLDDNGFVARVDRVYKPASRSSRRVLLTHNARFAETWMHAPDPRSGWRSIRKRVPETMLDRIQLRGSCYCIDKQWQQHAMIAQLVDVWQDPNRSIEGIEAVTPGVWALAGEPRPLSGRVIGPAWIGAGRLPDADEWVIGPDWRADDATVLSQRARSAQVLDFLSIQSPNRTQRESAVPRRSIYPFAKRSFDIVVSATLLLLLFPVLVAVAIAIVIDSGFPVLFAHRRQTMSGKPFDCLKFRTMHKHAEQLVPSLAEMNQCDGPQVYIKNDPRVTRLGALLRRFHLDELPQLWNVLKGEMSLVGPRPSPEGENQCCPAWRELRLSVRPGITGLWQVKRTRAPGRDFQEWIRYDIEYVRRASFWLDLVISFQTAYQMIFGRDR